MSKDVGLQTLSSSTDDLENWMSKLPEILKERPIIHLAIPGSHDSISYSISKNSPVSPDTIPFVKQLCKVFGPLVRPYIFKWSLTQHITVTDQLHNGIRYLDLRLATRRQNKDLFIVHGLYGNEIKNTLKEIDLFLTQHPLEIVILDFQHFYDFSVEAHTYMLSTLGQLFGNRLCPLPRDLGQVSLKWMRENWYQIVVIYRDFAAAGISTMWPGNRWPTPWPDTTSCPALFTFLEEKMALRPANAGYVTQCVLTPNVKFVVLHPLSSLETKCGIPCNRAALPWLRKQSPGQAGVNVVITDFIKMNGIPFSQTVIELNSKILDKEDGQTISI